MHKDTIWHSNVIIIMWLSDGIVCLSIENRVEDFEDGINSVMKIPDPRAFLSDLVLSRL